MQIVSRGDIRSLRREIKKFVFYRNGLFVSFAIFMVYIYRNTIVNPRGVFDLYYSIPLTILFFILYFNPRLCIYMITVWVPLRNLITGGVSWGGFRYYVLPTSFRYLDTAVLMIITVRWIMLKFQKRESLVRSPMGVPLLLLGLITLISAVANLTPPEIAILNIRTFAQYALLYYAIIQMDCDDEYLVKSLKFFLFVSMAQTLSSLLLFVSPAIESDYISKGDYAVGTMAGGTNLLALYEALLMCLTVGLMKMMPEKIKIYLPLFFWYMISFFTASGRSAIYFFPIGLFFIINQNIRSIFELIKSYLIAVVVVGICIGFFVFSGVGDTFYGEDLKRLSPDWLYQQNFEWNRSYGRTENYKMGWKILNEQAPSVLVGVGPGMYLSNTGIYFDVPLIRYAQIIPLGAIEKKQKDRYPPDLSIISTELGLIGTFVFALIYYTGYRIMRAGLKRLEDPFWKGLCAGSIGMIVVLCISIIPERSIEIVYMQHIFWFICALIQRRLHLEDEKSMQAGR